MWTKLIPDEINLEIGTKILPTKGKLVYEYNPFRNYRLSTNLYLYDGKYLSLKELETLYNLCLYKIVNEERVLCKEHEKVEGWAKLNSLEPVTTNTPELVYEKGLLVDFITDELHFSLERPVHIVPQASYDGSVNLIINDGLNIPRLINSRFSATGKNTYEIVDRKGNNDTNIYDLGDLFDIDTSLYKLIVKIPKIEYLGTSAGGNLKVGNYHFYFKLADADGNETDFVGESSLVSVFIGFGNPSSICTGTKNENSFKNVKFYIDNIDTAYDYISVYYSRYTAEGKDNSVTEYMKILKKFPVNNAGSCTLLITGFEEVTNVAATDINLNYNIVDAAHTSTVCQNMLFMGNVHRPDIPYKELTDLSLRFLPFLKQESYKVDINENYTITSTENGYYDTKFIYNKTGYWGNELYRLGIVYIMPNNELTPVFNIRGGIDITEFNDSLFTNVPVYNDEGKRNYINYNEDTNLITNSGEILKFENTKGVIRFNPTRDTDTIYGIDIRVDNDTINELKKYVKGYFFVRQTRIPTVLALGITVGIDLQSYTPCIPTAEGFLEELKDSLKDTHVTTEDINDVNFISEGFLSRYSFKFKKKSSSLWNKLGTALLVSVGVAIVTAAVIFAGPAIAAAAGTIAGAASAGGTATTMAIATAAVKAGVAAVGSSLLGVGIAGAAVVVGTTLVAAGLEVSHVLGRTFSKKKLDGRNTKVPSGYKLVETDDSRILSLDFYDRFIPKDSSKVKVLGIICPDYELNLPYYNQIFTGNNHIIKLTKSLGINYLSGHSSNYFTNNGNHFYIPHYYDQNVENFYNFKIIGVPDNTKLVGLESFKFRSRAGEAEEAWRYECIGDDYKSERNKKEEDSVEDEETLSNKEINTDIIRGSFGAYLGFTDDNNRFQPALTVNIYIPEYSDNNIEQYINIRMLDTSVFNAISDRYAINDIDDHLVSKKTALIGVENTSGYSWELYRGDCYLCLFTHRVNRNFNDPSAPYNDEIVDEKTWKDNYKINKTEKFEQINLGDINAILLGMWTTFKIRSSNNLNIRTLDGSYVDEAAMTGHERGYFPYYPMSTEGIYKHPESEVYNKGFSKSVSERWNFELPDVPHIKNWFGTRIMYSDIHINDAYKNGFRVFLGTNYRDYTREYGEIVKLISLESSLLCVFEHGIALIPVNERAVAGQGSGGNVYINTSNVLPENPKIISDMFGSQWSESVLKVPGKTGDAPQYVYGVDTVAKKIWRTDGNSIECISDFKVQEFLNNNITLGERELTPKIGIRNVKTHYNAFKRDVMFTFYDNTYGFEEKVWNLCWNELLQKFITFYSWVPSYMENINNIPFSFNRDTSKWIAKLGTSHTENSFADGITLTNVLIEDSYRQNGAAVSNLKIPVKYITKTGEEKTIYVEVDPKDTPKFIAGLSLSNRILPDAQVPYIIKFSLERDIQGNHKSFKVVPIKTVIDENGVSHENGFTLPTDAMFAGMQIPLYALCFNTDSTNELFPVYYLSNEGLKEVLDSDGNGIKTYKPLYQPDALFSELYYRNSAGNIYADYDTHKLGTTTITKTNVPQEWIENEEVLARLESELPPETIIGNTSTKYNRNNPPEYVTPCTTLGEIRSIMYDRNGEKMVHGIKLSLHWTVAGVDSNTTRKVWYELPIFKDITGKRPTLPKEELVNPDKLITLLNIKASISIVDTNTVSLSDTYYNMKASYAEGTSLIDAGYYESTVAITPRWNLLFLSTDFWKHGQAGLIDIADDIYPTYWYGKQHPFEFECVVVNDPSVHKIFDNLELVANKAKPESFHYEVIGEAYDFAKDKVNMYFRQEALKALWLYNGADICYDRNFLKVLPRQLARSADLPHKYYTRQDTINEIEDYYINITYPQGYDYRHLSGGEIVYYPNRQEYRVWNHAKAISLDDLSQDDARSIISANCKYLEDRWKITINPILVCYKNEYLRKSLGALVQPLNSDWTSPNRPKLPVMNSPIPDRAYLTILNNNGDVEIPKELTDLGYSVDDIDMSNWLNDVSVYKTNFGEAQNRKELDIRDKFIKIRIRYSGEELAVIDFLNTIYRTSYA